MEENNIINIHRLSDPNNRRSGPNLSTGEYTYLNGDIYKGQYHVDEYGKYMSGRFTTAESKELIKIGDALDVNNKLEISLPVPKNEINTSNENDDYVNYKIVRRYEGNVEKVIFGTIKERVPEIEGQNKNRYSTEDINKANKPKLKVNLKGIKYVPINYKLQGTTLSVDSGYYFIRPEKVIVSDFILSKVIDANFNYFIGANEQALTDISVCLIPNNETLEVMMFERNKTYNDVVSIERVDFSELATYPLGTFIKIAEVGARPLEGYTYYFINTNNNGNCVELSASWTPAIRKKVRNIIDPMVPIINNIPSNCCEDKEPVIIIVSGSDGKPGKDGKDGKDLTAGSAGSTGPLVLVPGPEGKAGKDGKDGTPGRNGLGLPGTPGKDGTPGRNGLGLPGTPGKDGTPGRNGLGLPGTPGKDGLNGKDGICPDCPKDVTPTTSTTSTTTIRNTPTTSTTSTTTSTTSTTTINVGTGAEVGNKYWKMYSCDPKKSQGYTSTEPQKNQIYLNSSNTGLYYWDGSAPEFLKTTTGLTIFTSLTKLGNVPTCPGSSGGGPVGRDITIYELHPCDGQGGSIFTYERMDTINQIATLTTGLSSSKTYQYRGQVYVIRESELGNRKVVSVSIEIGNLECSKTKTGGSTGGSTGGGGTSGGGGGTGGGSTGGNQPGGNPGDGPTGGGERIYGSGIPGNTIEFGNYSNVSNNQNNQI